MFNKGQKMYDSMKNEITINCIDNDYINATKKLSIKASYNDGRNIEYQDIIEEVSYNLSDIGIRLFYNKKDLENHKKLIIEDARYLFNKNNITNHFDAEFEKVLSNIKESEPTGPILNEQLKEKIIADYYLKTVSMEQEKRFNSENGDCYFGRIDLNTHFYRKNLQHYLDNHYYDKVYISKGLYQETSDGGHIVNWRSPIASLYYDNEKTMLARRHYVDVVNEYLHGKEIGNPFNMFEHELMLKRNYSFKPLRYNNTYITGNEFYSEGSADSFLMEVLIENKSNHKITDIIKSIQSNQNKMIREDKNSNMIVQGCAGSGKTMILLHRLSYLKFNSQLPSLSKTKIITPNNNFSFFIKDLAVSLELEGIERITMFNYYLSLAQLYQNSYTTVVRKNVQGEKTNLNEVSKNKEALLFYNSINFCEDTNIEGKIIDSYYQLLFFEKVKKQYDIAFGELLKSIFENDVLLIAQKLNLEITDSDRYSDKSYLDKIFNLCKNDIFLINDKIQKEIDILKKHLQKAENINKQLDETGGLVLLANSTLKQINEKLCEAVQTGKEFLAKSIGETSQTDDLQIINNLQIYVINAFANSKSFVNIFEELKNYFSDNRNAFSEEFEKQLLPLIYEYEKYISRALNYFKLFQNEEVYIKSKLINLNESVESCKKALYNIEDLLTRESESVKNYIGTLRAELKTKEPNLLNKNELQILNNACSILDGRGKFVLEVFVKVRNRYRNINQVKTKYKIYGKHEMLLLLSIYNLHCKELKNSEQFLVIDEGQDYCATEYKLLSSINGDKCCFNIYGDVNQCININRGIKEWESISEFLESNYYELNENYRNSVEITEFTNEKFKYNTLPIGVHGAAVEFIKFKQIYSKIKNDLLSDENARIAIIVNDDKMIPELIKQYKGDNFFVGNVTQAKGLEFDNVYVIPDGMSNNEEYISYTRALNKLCIVSLK